MHACELSEHILVQTLNDKHLTPFTLAARYAAEIRKWSGGISVLQHLMKKQEEVIWKFGTVSLRYTNLEFIDTFRIKEASREESSEENEGDIHRIEEAPREESSEGKEGDFLHRLVRRPSRQGEAAVVMERQHERSILLGENHPAVSKHAGDLGGNDPAAAAAVAGTSQTV